MLKAREITVVEYTNRNGEDTVRTILPTYVPEKNIKAIDVTSMDDEQRECLRQLFVEYTDYVDQHINKMFNFEDWVEHVANERLSLKWRTFKPENLRVK